MAGLHIRGDTEVDKTGIKLSQINTNKTNISTNATNIATNKTNITNLTNTVSPIGTYKETYGNNKYINPGTSNLMCTLTLSAGTWIVIGWFKYESSTLRYYFSVHSRSTSAYDKDGYVECTLSDFVVTNQNSYVVNCYLWINDKSITVANYGLKAIRIK